MPTVVYIAAGWMLTLTVIALLGAFGLLSHDAVPVWLAVACVCVFAVIQTEGGN